MEGDFIKINRWLTPLSWLYGIGVRLRNFCFDVGLLKSRAYTIPVISVGNITVGGTGKTPHVEYLVRLLQDKVRLAVLSRGYKRKTSGYVCLSADSTAPEVGDEPVQIKQKFPGVTVAVSKSRCKGIEQLQADDAELETIILDDAFQHRYVKPGVNILLVDYHRLIIYDRLLPAGRLREPLSGKNRADIVIVTKCPADLKPMDFRVITKAMNLYPYQSLFFTALEYEPLRPLSPQETAPRVEDGQPEHILLLTGIASPLHLLHDLQSPQREIVPLTFADHHHFKKKDLRRLRAAYDALPAPKRIVTTEKDATRLMAASHLLDDDLRRAIWVLPVRVRFLLDQAASFNDHVIGYVRKNSKNNILTKHKEDRPQERVVIRFK